jgi:crotonobetainyl-CoA:carnitine CoA-transferase CaiB-like acyl-CoA transferase
VPPFSAISAPKQFLDSPKFPGLRNCRLVGLNLKSQEGLQIFYELVKTANVVTESYRPGVVERLAVDYETLKKINPSIIYTSISGFGQDGPYRDHVGHDINYISIAGLLGMTGPAGGAPVLPGTLIGDFAAGGMSAAIGILAALTARERTGTGQFVDVSMTEAVVGLMGDWIKEYFCGSEVHRRGETMFTGLWPWYNVYETQDGGYISIGAVEPRFYTNLCQLLERDDLIEHQYAEGEKQEEIFRIFRETFLTRKRDEWVEILRQKDVCVAPVYSMDEVVSDTQLIHRGTIQEVPHPTLGSTRQVGPVVRLSNSPFQIRNWSTWFGQHTEEVLLELGYASERIDALRRSGAIT